MPTAEADDIMECYRAWEPETRVLQDAKAVPDEAFEAMEQRLGLALHPALFYQQVEALLKNNPGRALSAAVGGQRA